jgi:hypothetical protein
MRIWLASPLTLHGIQYDGLYYPSAGNAYNNQDRVELKPSILQCAKTVSQCADEQLQYEEHQEEML